MVSKRRYAYSLFPPFPVTCEQSVIGKACYLSSWWMRYGMMKQTLLLSAKYLGIFLQKFKINSLSPQWCWIFYQSHILVLLKTFHISCLLFVEFYQVLLILVERFIMLPRSKSRTRHICVLLLYWKYAKTCFHPLKVFCSYTGGRQKYIC